MLSKLPDHSLSRSSFDNVWVITLVSISIGPAGMSAGFMEISFNCEGEDTLVVVPLRGHTVYRYSPDDIRNALVTTTIFEVPSLLYFITDPLLKSFGSL